jgi:AraC-like DNA-binding protein
MKHYPPIDRLSSLLERFKISAELMHNGVLCGVNEFTDSTEQGYLHVLRKGSLDLTHHKNSGLAETLHLDEPSLLFYPCAIPHQFHNSPTQDSDFTCARLSFDGGKFNPLVKALPKLVLLPLRQIEGLDAALSLLFAEAERVRCGHKLLADRLFEVVFIQLLRWMLDNPRQVGIHSGLFNGLSDPRLARALNAMHETPGYAWDLYEMAKQAGMSRTAFSQTFKLIVGQTPADYLADWRITLIQAGLCAGRPLAILAEEVGYSNPSSLSRMFASKVGLSAAQWLKTQQ